MLKRITRHIICFPRGRERCLGLLFFITFFFLQGCVSLIRPNGESWSRPVDLALTPGSLKNVTVEVRCLAASEGDDSFYESESKACRDISRNLANIGATVYYPADETYAMEGKKPENVDFSFAYVERDTTGDSCGWTIIPFIFTVGIFPCVRDFQSTAELLIFSSDNLIVERKNLKVDSVGIYGGAALYYLLVKNTNFGNLQTRNRNLSRRLLQYVQNVAVTYNTRRLLAEPRPGEDEGASP